MWLACGHSAEKLVTWDHVPALLGPGSHVHSMPRVTQSLLGLDSASLFLVVLLDARAPQCLKTNLLPGFLNFALSYCVYIFLHLLNLHYGMDMVLNILLAWTDFILSAAIWCRHTCYIHFTDEKNQGPVRLNNTVTRLWNGRANTNLGIWLQNLNSE